MLQDILTKYKSCFTCHTELRAQMNTTFSLMLSDDGTLQHSLNSKGGISARMYKNGAYGFAATSVYDDKHVKEVLDAARFNTSAIAMHRKTIAKDLPYVENGIIPLNYEVQSIDVSLLISVAEDMKLYAEKKYPSTKATISMSNSSSEKLLVVYNGMDGRSNIVLGNITVNIEGNFPDGRPAYGYAIQGIDTYLKEAVSDPSSLYKLVDEAYAKMEKSIAEENNKVMAEGGTWDCILSPEFTSMLAHEAVGHTCEADAVVLKGSVAAEYMGKQVASPLVSLTDFAYTAYGQNRPIPLHIDDEGIACKDAPIIKNGILVGCMNNRETALRLCMEPTGNARASEYYDEPIIRMRNTCFLPGTSKLEDMIASIDKGYYLTRSGGGNGSLKGEFNMMVSEGYEIIHGKLGRPIMDTICAGLAWDALKTVDMVSSNFENDKNCGICGKKQFIPTSQGGPEMKLKLNIGGK